MNTLQIELRYPRLIKAIKRSAIYTNTEAIFCIQNYLHWRTHAFYHGLEKRIIRKAIADRHEYKRSPQYKPEPRGHWGV